MGTVGNAQSQTGLDKVQVSKIGTATINMATGEIIRGQSADKSAGLVSAFVNTDTSGFYGTGAVTNTLTGNNVEWLDFGVVQNATGSDIVGSFTFGYGTSVTDTILGGPGASVVLGFYDGISGFCVDSGNAPTAQFSFTGLPGTAPGTGAGWLVSVDLQGGFEFCSAGVGNNFGFGLLTSDSLGGTSRSTGPLLCYAGDPFGPNGNATQDPDSNGQLDVFDEWDTNPTSNICLGTFFFGGTPFNISSWYLTFETADTTGAALASASFRNGGSNPGNYAVVNPPVLGATFDGTDTQTNGGLGVFIVGFATPLSFSTSFGQLLVNVADPGGELLAGFNGPYIFAGGVAAISLPVPKNLNLCGLALSTQTFEFGGGVQLHNAQDLIVGF